MPELVDPQDAQAATQRATKLVENPDIALTCQNLLAGRRLYHMARVVLNRQLREQPLPAESSWGEAKFDTLAEEVIVQAMGSEANKPYTDEELLQQVSTSTLAFLSREIRRSKEAEAQAAQQEAALEEAHRRDLRVPLGFTLDGQTDMGRSCPLLLVGPRKAVSYVLGLAINAAAQEPDQGDRRKVVVAHLVSQMLTANVTDKDKTYVRIGINHTVGSANSHKTFDKLLSLWRRQTYKHRVDLLVVENLAQLYDAGISGRSDLANAASANKSISKWAHAAGCAVLAGIPLADDVYEAFQAHGEDRALTELRQHAAVKVVRVGPAQDGQEAMVEIMIGDQEGRLTVAKQLLE